MWKREKNVPKFLGWYIRRKMMDDDSIETWYRGLATVVLDDNEFSTACELWVKYDGFEEEYDVLLVEEWQG